MPPPLKRFDTVELTAIVLFAILATGLAWTWGFKPEPQAKYTIDPKFTTEFENRFGPERFSSGLEEYIVRDFFNDRRDGVFIDVGAFHAREASNTYRLERDLGWSGLALDANASFAPEYKQHRPRSTFLAAFVGDIDTGTGTIHVYDGEPGVASHDAAFTAEWGKANRTLTAPNRTLDSLLAEHNITHVDFVSMDIETGEPAALAGFTIARYRPALLCVEAHYPVRQQILDYFARAGYVLVGKYAQADPLNYYFAPIGTAPAP
jgi:FkbM family methyltransferase